MKRCVYLPGLGTGPASTKGRHLAAALAPAVQVEQVELRVPSPERPSVAAMLATAEAELARAPVDLLVGTSLGGLVALHAAARVPVGACLLLAPALGLGALPVERPLAAWFWRQFGFPVRDKAAGCRRWVGASVLDEVVALGPPPPPTCVTSLVHGRRDRLTPLSPSVAFVAQNPSIRLVVADDGHDLADHLDLVVAEAARLLGDGVR